MDLSWDQILKSLVFWGPGAVIAALIIGALYKLANKFGGQFISAQQSQATALGQQAASMAGLTQSLQNYIVRDNAEHREMLVLLKYVAQRHQTFEEVAEQHYSQLKKCMKCEENNEVPQH